ncbi:MAG: tyrosine--tRNA ligase [Candidatus Doudnabacteria bacterium RIFCSPHIGHO2_01_FULL_45_18]|uniref:Tyrosine--tRNA ligase n=1 Tax=Candidatus Doudnabacteria bacterium RIFCSPHIGHO2_01_FULL_45_18 TaxID=1817823 RepID=A0A1F5NRC3_9BACT|nr:MAG: tyrosine--tRNA ligase [Candidatus Doudnabacteria bacterium RIFCSPHIGHO2_01_FULL_45_18]
MNQKITELLTRSVAEVIDQKHIEDALNSGKKLRVKLGIDPTSPNIHIGRAVVLWKLRQFQDLGHQVVLIVGDFTGLIGDTSDKDSERPMLTEAEIKSHMKTYQEQAFKILDPKKTEVRYNSEWLSKLGFQDIGKMADLFGLHEMEAREVISKRLKAGKRVSFRELLYPIMQGYDSVAIAAQVELGGTDQRFNLLAGRTIQPAYSQPAQDILTTNLLEGTDGRKMSSSWGNVINLTDEPNDMFGKVMSIADELMMKYFEHATQVPMDEIKKLEPQAKTNPRDIKIRLATEIVNLYYSQDVAQKASKEWEKVFSNKEKPTNIEEMKVSSSNIVDVLVETKLATSKSEAKRLIEQNGVKIDDVNATEESDTGSGNLIQVGKRKFIKII